MPKKTTTKKRTSKKTIDEIEFADGRIEDKQKTATDIESLLAVRGRNPFGTAIVSDFEGKLGEMNLSQMQELAVKASIFPSGNKTSLKNKLKREFRSRFGSDGEAVFNSQSEAPLMDPNSSLAKEIMDILNS
tara:strand:- start:1298 stop:1693 length:396 start_codon:yes stop_codon:yes gene_type:complete